MPFAIAAAAVGVAGTVYASNKAAKTSKAGIDAQRELAGAANELGAEKFEWDKWVYETDIAPANKANQELQFLLAEDYLDTSKTNKDFANEQRDEYRTTYLPNERRVAADAATYDSDENTQRRSGVAAANVNQQFSNATAQRARTLGRYGLNPNSSAFSSQSGKDAIAQAGMASGAATGAAFDTKDRAIALRSGVANFGRNMPNTAAQANATSNASNAGASTTSQASANAAGAGAGFMNGAYNARIGGLTDYGNTLGVTGARESALWGNVAQGLGSLTGAAVQGGGGWGALGNKIGGFFGSSGNMPDFTQANANGDY
jgi:hypothetical protein